MDQAPVGYRGGVLHPGRRGSGGADLPSSCCLNNQAFGVPKATMPPCKDTHDHLRLVGELPQCTRASVQSHECTT